MSKVRTAPFNYNRKGLETDELMQLYVHMKESRLIEEKMLILLRQGKISKWFSGIGQEAISVSATMALQSDEFIFPMHRNLGVFTTRQIPFHRLFCQWQGKASGFTKGRDRSFHFGTIDYHIVGMISHLGPQLSLASGVALANKLKKQKKISLAFTGEGGTSQGEFHEALNVASVWQLPVIFLVENNGYGLSTPIEEQFKCKDLADRAKGYGMRSVILEGNNVLEVYKSLKKIAEEIREHPEPVLVECKTFRVRGHEEASGVKYVPKALIESWKEKDPLINYEQYLQDESILDADSISQIEADIKSKINEGLDFAFAESEISSSIENEILDLYAPHKPSLITAKTESGEEKRLIDAIRDGLDLAMEKYEDLVLMGQDIAEYGGVFKITEGFVEKYGKSRVRNTPLCESAILGISAGLSIKGMKAMVEMQFADFVTCGFNQIVNNLAKMHYRWGQNMDVIVRMPTGGDLGAGPFHSQSNEAWFTHTPGLKVLYPSTPADAKGLLLAAFEDPNPILFFEHKALYRNVSETVPSEYYTTEIGKAKLWMEGNDLSIISYGASLYWCKSWIEENDISADLLDLRTLSPLDYSSIAETVHKTGKVIIVHEDNHMGGIGSDISAYISEHLFEYLDGPVMICASLNTPIPFAKSLEKNYLSKARLDDMASRLLAY